MSHSSHDEEERIPKLAFKKLAQMIVQARVDFTHAPSRLDGAFQLKTPDLNEVSSQLDGWHQDIKTPLYIYIGLVQARSSDDEQQSLCWADDAKVLLLERWCFSLDTKDVPRESMWEQRAIVAKRLCLMLRSLCSYLRQLPAFRFVRQRRRKEQKEDWRMLYRFHSKNDAWMFEEAKETRLYHFAKVPSNIGSLQLTVEFRKDMCRFVRADATPAAQWSAAVPTPSDLSPGPSPHSDQRPPLHPADPIGKEMHIA
jgi:hypothetical protein